MNETITRRQALEKAILFGVLFVIISYLLGFCWETNDDTAIATLLLSSDFSPFQWGLLSKVLHGLYMQFPVVSWWAVCTVFSIWISAFVFVYVIYQRYSSKMAFQLSVLVLMMLWLVALYEANFTRTAAVISLAGILLIANSLFPVSADFSRSSIAEYIVGCILLLHGASIRGNCALFSIAFLAVIGLIYFLSDHFTLKWSWFWERRKKICLLCLVPVLFFSGRLLNQAMRTPEQQEYARYNSLRSAIEDYTSGYPTFEENPDAYLAAGWDEIDRKAFFNWFSEDTEVFTVEAMEQIGKLRVRTYDFSSLTKILTGNPAISVLVFATIFLLCCLRKRNWIYGLSSCGLLLLLCVYLVLQGRFPSRVYHSIMFSTICATAFLCGGENASAEQSGKPFSIRIRRLYKVSAVVFCTGLIVFGLFTVHKHYTDSMGNRCTILQRAKADAQRVILDELDADKEHLYIFDSTTSPASLISAFTFWEIRPLGYCDNRFGLGGWTARAPYRIEQLANNGITNPVRALFERTDVYSLYSSRLLNFLRAHYDERMTVSGIKPVPGKDTEYVQYTAAIDDSQIQTDPSMSKKSTVNEFYQLDKDQWYISATISDSSDQERVFYCNLDVDGVRYTYRLSCVENQLSAILYGIDKSFDPSTTQIRIFEKCESGYIEYANSSKTQIDLLPYMTGFHDCQVTVTDEGLIITDTGIDAQLEFTVPEIDGWTVAGISVEMDTQTSSIAQLYVATQEVGYQERRSRSAKYEAGSVSLVLNNPYKQPISLRFDPTKMEGQTIVLRSVELILVDPVLFS